MNKLQPRKIYYRKKGDSFIIYGRNDAGIAVFLWTLPDPGKLILKLIENGSFFTGEKSAYLMEKIQGLAIREKKVKKSDSKVPVTHIRRIPEQDPILEENGDDEDIIEPDDDVLEEIEELKVPNSPQ